MAFPDRAIEHFEVDLEAEVGGQMETLDIVTDE